MKSLLLIPLLCGICLAQEPEWKLIKEMSGEMPNYPSLPVETRAQEIARGEDYVKLTLRVDFPNGAPYELFKKHVPHGFDPSSISRFESRLELNCKTLGVKAVKASGMAYQFNGKAHKSKEPPFQIASGHIFEKYFCEQPETAPTKPPTLKPKP